MRFIKVKEAPLLIDRLHLSFLLYSMHRDYAGAGMVLDEPLALVFDMFAEEHTLPTTECIDEDFSEQLPRRSATLRSVSDNLC